MKIAVAKADRWKADVYIHFAYAPAKPSAGALGKAVGDVRVTDGRAERKTGAATRVLVSLGPNADCTTEIIRRAGGAVARWLRDHDVRRAAVDVAAPSELQTAGAIPALCEGLVLGSFQFSRHRSDPGAGPDTKVQLVGASRSAELARAVRRAGELSEAVNLARDWGDEPPNVINPVTLARRARRLATQNKLKCRIYDEKQLARMNANAILQVGAASKTPSRLIVLEYAGAGKTRPAKPVVLVGKAITFDTGGYSIKDKVGIVGMKYDKCGGMTVVGVMQAVAALKLRTPVVGIIAAAENMISGSAYRPNDIITTMSGKTVEIISTDAEGRMVLADALTYAQQHYKPEAVIDLATLTGGVVVALGSVRAGLFANHDALATQLLESGEHVHEKLWRLPLDDEYLELIKGDHSDLKNSGGRSAHPIIGGIFLKQFVDDGVPWAHLDIAGVGDCEKDLPYCPKGATGFGVRLLVDYLSKR